MQETKVVAVAVVVVDGVLSNAWSEGERERKWRCLIGIGSVGGAVGCGVGVAERRDRTEYGLRCCWREYEWDNLSEHPAGAGIRGAG